MLLWALNVVRVCVCVGTAQAYEPTETTKDKKIKSEIYVDLNEGYPFSQYVSKRYEYV